MMLSGMRASRALPLLLGAMLLTVSGCGQPEPIFSTFPPVEDVRPEPKPVPGVDVLESEEAANLFDSKLEAWGERGWAAVKRICEDAVRKGAPYPNGWCRSLPD